MIIIIRYFRQYSKDSIPVDRRPVSDFNRKLSGSSSSSFSSQEEERTHYVRYIFMKIIIKEHYVTDGYGITSWNG